MLLRDNFIRYRLYFSHDGEFVISGSEDHYVYMWRAQHRIPSSRKDKNDFYESFSGILYILTVSQVYMFYFCLVKTYSCILLQMLQSDWLRYSLSIRQKISSSGE